MHDPWPESVERVAHFLRDVGAEARVEEFPSGTPTAEDAAQAVGCHPRNIVKSIVLECDGVPVLAMVPGDRRVDLSKVAAEVGARRARIAPAERVRELTGFDPGAVAPFPLLEIDRALLDRRLLPLERVWVGAGSHRHMASLAPAELARLTRADALDIAGDK